MFPWSRSCRNLWAAGYRLGILSNTCEAHWEYVSDGRYMVVRDLFELRVLSYEERCSKPEVAIYEVAARRAGTDPERIFFVDDRPENVRRGQASRIRCGAVSWPAAAGHRFAAAGSHSTTEPCQPTTPLRRWPIITDALCPPKPKLLLMAILTCRSRG